MDQMLCVNLSVTRCLHTSGSQVDHVRLCYEDISSIR